MEKLKKITWVHLLIGSFAFIVIAYSILPAFGLMFGLVYATIGVCLYVLEAITAKREKDYITLRDCQIAREIVTRAFTEGKIDRMAFARGELFLTREINVKKMALGSVRRGSRIELAEYEKAHRYF